MIFAAFILSTILGNALAGHDSWSCVDSSIFETRCVAVTWNNPSAAGLVSAFGGGGRIIVGVTALGAANGEGTPRLGRY